MKIAYLITRSDTIGGAHVHVRDLSQNLMRAGHEVLVMVGGEGPFTEQLRERGVSYVSLKHLVRAIKPMTDLRVFGELAGHLRKFKPDLFSTHSAKAGWVGRSVGRTLGIPTLFTAHGWAFTEGIPERQRRFYVGLEKLTAGLATKIITVSDYDRMLALREGIASKHKIITVHNGVPDVAHRAQHSNAPMRLINVARLEEQKDHALLIRALATLAHKPWDLTIVGDGPLMAPCQALARELGIAERIKFLGLRKDVPECLANSNAFVLATNWEGFPRSILEAMRAGLPVVASDVAGTSESVQDGQTGYLVPRGDQAKLTERLANLIDDPTLRATMGARGRARYESEFTFEHMLKSTLSVYESVRSQRN